MISARSAIATVAPTINGRNSSRAAMSKAIVVIASRMSSRLMPGRCAMLHNRLTSDAMGDLDPFGSPGRARGKDQIGRRPPRVIGDAGARSPVPRWIAPPLPARSMTDDTGADGQFGCAPSVSKRRHIGVRQDVAQAFDRMPWIERHIGAAGFPHREQRDEHRRRALDENPDPRSGAVDPVQADDAQAGSPVRRARDSSAPSGLKITACASGCAAARSSISSSTRRSRG